MVSFDPLNDHELPDGGMSFGNMRLATEDTGRKFPFNDRAVSRLDNIRIIFNINYIFSSSGSNISLNSPCLVKSCRLLRDF
jgi:hypothetical protein